MDSADDIRYAILPSVDGEQKIAYRAQKPERWNKKTVVLLSGLSRNMDFWNAHADHLLAGGFQVVRLDFNNIGRTLSKNGIRRYSRMENDRDAVTAVLEDAGISHNLYLVGHSRGAAIAFMAAKELEGRGVKIEGVLAANPYVEWLENYYMGNFGTSRLDAHTSWAKSKFLTIAREALRQRGPEEIVPGLSEQTEADAIAEVLAEMVDTNIIGIANKIAAPVTLISSDNVMEPAPLIAKLSSALNHRGPRQYLGKGKDHLFPLSDPREFQKILDEFLAR
jgi:pimeloyl-ACP methyl ester carboxylesterase